MERERHILQHNLFLPLFNELVIKNTSIKKNKTTFFLNGRSSPASESSLITKRQNVSLKSYHKLY